MEIFKNDNLAYQKWIKSNPKAFVINTKPSKGDEYRVAHRTSCVHIIDPNNPARSTKLYIKICGKNPNEIASWFTANKTHFDGTFYECGKCEPAINRKIKNPVLLYSNEVFPGEKFVEGAVRKVLVNSYERNIKARNKCLEHFGFDCVVCGFNFEKKYGEIGKDFIHVHHLKEISQIGQEYEINPQKDLVPVCPNCHAMLHSGSNVLSIKKLKNHLQ